MVMNIVKMQSIYALKIGVIFLWNFFLFYFSLKINK